MKAECRAGLGSHQRSAHKTLRVRVRLISYIHTPRSAGEMGKKGGGVKREHKRKKDKNPGRRRWREGEGMGSKGQGRVKTGSHSKVLYRVNESDSYG